MRRLKFFRCPDEHCGYEGKPEKALKPRPSRKPVLICPSCLSEVKRHD